MNLTGTVGAVPRRHLGLFSLVYLVVGCGSGIGLIGKLPLLHKIFHLPTPVIAVGCAVMLCLPLFWKAAVRHCAVLSVAFAVLLTIASLVVYPRINQLHAAGHGSDQAACVIVVAEQMTSLRWPYDVSLMWSHNPMSCGAGWVMLQAIPIRLAGYGATQMLLCFGSLAVIWRSAGERTALLLASMVTLCPGVWLCAADGADFLSFGMALTAILVMAMRGTRTIWGAWLFSVAAVLIYQFRTPVVVMPGLLRKKLGAAWSGAIGLCAIAMQTAFFLWNPTGYVNSGPMWIMHKFIGRLALEGKPRPLIAVVVAGMLCVLSLALWLGRKMEPIASSLGCLLLLLAVPAVIDLAGKFHQQLPWQQELGSWEGGPWLAACVPLAALAMIHYQGLAGKGSASGTKVWEKKSLEDPGS